MNNLGKAALIGVGAFVGLRLLMGGSGGGAASQCVGESVAGNYRSYTNTCKQSVNAKICSRYLIGSEKCSLETVGSGSFFVVTATETAPMVIKLISPVSVRISACKLGYRPHEMTEDSSKYQCDKMD